MNSWSVPERVGLRHAANQQTNVRRNDRSIEPGEDGLGFDDDDRCPPFAPDSRQPVEHGKVNVFKKNRILGRHRMLYDSRQRDTALDADRPRRLHDDGSACSTALERTESGISLGHMGVESRTQSGAAVSW